MALRHLARHLAAFPISLLAPDGLDLAAYRDWLPRATVERASPTHFASVHAYNALMLGTDVYERYEGFDYLLCHQLDAAVFSDALLSWCERGYDYVGAPWMRVEGNRLICAGVGNGGLSLRCVAAALRVLRAGGRGRWATGMGHIDARLRLLPQDHIDLTISEDALRALVGRAAKAYPDRSRRRLYWSLRAGPSRFLRRFRRHEDYFWSFAAPLLDPAFRVAPPEEALRFAVETEPARCLAALGGRLPFGCHAWHRHGPEVWMPHLAAG